MPTTPTLTPNILVGKAVALTVGGTLMFVKGGSVTRNAASIKVTNAQSQGYQQVKAGIFSASFSFDLVYNGDAPPNLMEGTEVTIIFDSVGYEVGDSIANPSSTPLGRLITSQALITSIKDTWVVDGDYGWSVECDSTGKYTAVDTATGATPET